MNTLFFAHATGFPSPSYAPFFEALQQQGYATDCIEKIAHNPKYPITNNWPYLVDELENAITRKHQEPVIGIGHSAGGLISYLLAQRNPEIYSHLILLDPPVINGWQNILWWLAKRLGFSDQFTPAASSKNRRTHFDSYNDAYESLRHKRLFKDFPETSFTAYLEQGLITDTDGRLTLAFEKEKELALFRTSSDNLWRHTRPLTIPGLYLTSEGSEFAKWPFARRFAKRSQMEFKVLTGGHLFPQEYPQETSEVIAKWLGENTKP